MSKRSVALRKLGTPGWTSPGKEAILRKMLHSSVIVDPGAFDFTTGTLDDRVTFSRASAGTYFDALGVMQTASTDVPRFDHNPLTGEPIGILIEEARTNNVPDSTGVSWGTDGVTLTTDGTKTPWNVDAVKLTNLGTGARRSRESLNITNNTTYRGSVFAKAGTTGKFSIRLDFVTPGTTLQFDLASLPAGSVTLKNGWYRLPFTYTPTANGGSSEIQLGWQGTSGVSVNDYVYIAGLMMEATSGPASSLIITNDTGTVTRAADVLSLTLPYLSNDLTVTFDDDSTQVISGVASPYQVPTNLNRSRIKAIHAVEAQ